MDAAIRKMLASDSYGQAAQRISLLMRATRWTPAEKGASAPDPLVCIDDSLMSQQLVSDCYKRAAHASHCSPLT